MPDSRVLPYGSWPSPISIEMVTGAEIALREPSLDRTGATWIEGRPSEGGRQVLVHWDGQRIADRTPPPFNARNMVHEYGGGAYAPGFFTNLADGRIYRLGNEQPVPLTAEGSHRFADLTLDHFHDRLLCVREEHGSGEPRNTLVAVDTSSGEVTLLDEGHDFYSTPRPSPLGGERLAWLAWDHPNMPWDGTQLWVADIDADWRPANARMVAGGAEESVVQPEWLSEHELVFASDRSGWWNLYRLDLRRGGDPQPLLSMEADFAGPQWVFGMRWYDVSDGGTIVAAARSRGRSELWRIPRDGAPARIDVPDEQIDSVVVQGSAPRRVAYLGASWDQPRSLVLLDLESGTRTVVRRSSELSVDHAYLSRPEAIEFPTTDGDTAHALYYPPTNPDCRAADGEKPPLVVMSHGGPTSSAHAALDLEKQLFTSRGFAVVDVDYRGSTGYGRGYMRRLDGKWGIYDVDDCVAGARYLAERGDVDPARMAIRGGSAGGYTTLCALTFHDVFAAGASHYGVGDLEALARDTHKFESRYINRLVAPFPEQLEIFHERSPIRYVERLSVPLIVLQGADDKVVPVAQAEQIVDALRRQRIPHAYLLFEGEGHGFRQEANIRRALEAELSFYAQVFGFALADDIESIRVEFL